MLLAQKLPEQPQRFAITATSALDRHAVGAVLVFPVTHPHAEDEAATRHDREQLSVLGQAHRMIERQHHHVRAQRQPLRRRREAGQAGQRRPPVVLALEVVLLEPDRVKTSLLPEPHLFERLGIFQAALGRCKAELHG